MARESDFFFRCVLDEKLTRDVFQIFLFPPVGYTGTATVYACPPVQGESNLRRCRLPHGVLDGRGMCY